MINAVNKIILLFFVLLAFLFEKYDAMNLSLFALLFIELDEIKSKIRGDKND